MLIYFLEQETVEILSSENEEEVVEIKSIHDNNDGNIIRFYSLLQILICY